MRWPLWRVAVVERSMEPALHPGDWLLVWRGTRAGRAVRVRPGQLVIARHPGRPDLLLVKGPPGASPAGGGSARTTSRLVPRTAGRSAWFRTR
jgi:hypothetical protein